jgi:hypothetical protein
MVKTRSGIFHDLVPIFFDCFHGLLQCLTFHLPLLFVSENTKHVAYFYWTLSSNFNHYLEIFNCPIDHCGLISTIDLTIENFQLLPIFFWIIVQKLSITTWNNFNHYRIVVIESCFNCYMD